ncbi:DUF885 domain-containing protein [Sphingomonas sp. URHD0057]|uniref:DUF885 domain-containing protein n=1 Tax=Sphingomonas sp. URHD0057 TaxID=1380389 RepID=UPI000566FD7A|nr:DUF885 domain-containing protein [Sphingomonas sp. URHD0057]
MPNLTFTRREAVAALAASAAALPLVSCRRAGSAASDADAGKLLDSIGENLLRLSPSGATTLGVDTGGRAALRSQLEDRSAAGRQRVADLLKQDLARAEAFDVSALSFPVRTSVEVVRSAYTTALEGFAQPYGDVAVGGWRNTPYVVIQNVGAYLDIPRFLDAEHPIETRDDADAYLARLQAYPIQLDGELDRMRSARSAGLIPPDFLLDKALTAMATTIKDTASGGGLVESIERRTREKKIPGDWAAKARAIAQQQVLPALKRQVGELKVQRALAKGDPGMWARPHGDDYYRWALKASTTTTMSPEEVHQMGLQQVADLHGRMDPILRAAGYTSGSVGERMKQLAKDPRYKFSEGDKGRAEIMAFIQERLKLIRAQLPRAFHTMVKGNLEVRRLPPAEEPGAPGAYGGAGSIDGKIPGKFWINLLTTDLHRKYDLPDLAAHEAIPGHVWQGEYAHKLPLIRTQLAFNAYSEGWALYAEQLVDELGVYDDFPEARLGYLQSLAFRAARLVVDTGLHAKRWSRQQGVDYFVDINGSNPGEVASEVDRYCSWPGQACGYKVGHTTIVRERDKAKAALGPKFDLRYFDDAVVLGGNVPMDVLAKNVGDYVARTRNA